MKDNFIYGEPLSPRVKNVIPIIDYKLLLEFDNGEQRRFDAKPLLSMKAFQPLLNNKIFSSVRVEHGTIIWLDDIDYCPDTLYNESIPHTPLLKEIFQ
jgi:hypothetical protein